MWWPGSQQVYNTDPNSNIVYSNGMMGPQPQQHQSFESQVMPQPQQPKALCQCPQCMSPTFQHNFNDISLNRNYSIPPVPSPNMIMSPTLSSVSSTTSTRSRTSNQHNFPDSTSPLNPNSPAEAPKEDKRRKLPMPEDPVEAARLEKKRKTNKEAAARARERTKKIKEELEKLLAAMGDLSTQIEATRSIEEHFQKIHDSEIGANMRRMGMNTELLVRSIGSIKEWFANVKMVMETKEKEEDATDNETLDSYD